MKRKKAYFFIVIIILLKQSIFAHQDYAGDVHPFVFANNDTFVVQFYNNKEQSNYISKYNISGKAIVERNKIEDFVSQPKPSAIPFQFDPTLNPISMHDNKWYQLVNINVPKKIDKPFILVYNDSSIVDTIIISWGKYSKADMHSVFLDDKTIIGLTSKENSKDLSFFNIENFKTGNATYKTIGQPIMIWGLFPQVSDILRFGKYAVIVWIRKDERFIVTAWNMETGKIHHHEIEGIKEWNTKPQIAMIKNKMIVSYHTIQGVKRKNGSVVKNIFLEFPFKE